MPISSQRSYHSLTFASSQGVKNNVNVVTKILPEKDN